MSARRLLFAGAALAVLVAGCTAPPEVSDGAPLRSITAAEVADAVPRPDPIVAAGNKSPYTVNGVTYQVLEDAQGYREQGIASWYGTKFHGQQTSNGERFDLYQATAAHKTLPIPCYVRVTNLNNDKSVVVRVNDRGPFHADRLIDLSYGAAIKLGYMERGTAPVQVELLSLAGVDDRRGVEGDHYRYLQLGAFGLEASAQRLQYEMQQLLAAPVFISTVQTGDNLLYRVRVGPVGSGDELLAVQRQLQDRGYNPGQPLP